MCIRLKQRCNPIMLDFRFLQIRMRNGHLCTESTRAIQQYYASLPFDQGVYAQYTHQSGLQPKFSGLCTRTSQSHLVVISIARNAIGFYDFVRIAKTNIVYCLKHRSFDAIDISLTVGISTFCVPLPLECCCFFSLCT